MAQTCKVCSSSVQARIDSALLAGETVASVQRAHPSFSDSAVRRHYNNHVRARIVAKVAQVPGLDVGDLVLRLVQVANDIQAVRNQAVATRNGSATLRAANSELAVLRELTQTLGVTDADVQTYMTEAMALANAAGEVARQHPDLGRLLAVELRDSSPQLAATFQSLSANTRQLPEQDQI